MQLSDTKWSVSAGLTKHKKHLQQHWKKAEAAAKKATDSFGFYIVKMLLIMGLMALVGGMNYASAENYLPSFYLDGFVGLE